MNVKMDKAGVSREHDPSLADRRRLSRVARRLRSQLPVNDAGSHEHVVQRLALVGPENHQKAESKRNRRDQIGEVAQHGEGRVDALAVGADCLLYTSRCV